MNAAANEPISPKIERARMDVDIVCVGFGPATGFQTTLPIFSARRGVDTRTGST